MKFQTSSNESNYKLETNLRIVKPGSGLWVDVRYADVTGNHLSSDLLERLCGQLRYRKGLAAIALPGNRNRLVVATSEEIPDLKIEELNRAAKIKDSGERQRIYLESSLGRSVIPPLVERALEVQLFNQTARWAIVGSPRHWYERESFDTINAVDAYRRIALGTILIDDVGIGVAVDVETSFFTAEVLSWFFDYSIKSTAERERRREFFLKLVKRSQGQGTLVYSTGSLYTTCYFYSAPEGMTCGTTPEVRVRGKSYPTLLDYYRAENPTLPVTADTPAIYVLFKGIETPQPVAANRLKLRIFNDNLPTELSNITQIAPTERRDYLQRFWEEFKDCPLGKITPGFYEGFWRPEPDKIKRLVQPDLEFAHGRTLRAPRPESDWQTRKDYYRNRLEMLKGGGCYDYQSPIRTIYCVHSQDLCQKIAGRLNNDVCALLSDLTGKKFSARLENYTEVRQGIDKMLKKDASDLSGTVLFVLNDEPGAYYEIDLYLGDWRPKRVTEKIFASITNG